MTRDPSHYSRMKRVIPRQADRRRVNALKGVPLIGGLGLVFNERRSHRERRRSRRSVSHAPPCALLQGQEPAFPEPGLFRSLRSGWHRTAIGAWIRRHLKYPWNPKARRPGEQP